jgi:hypothetical protein
MAPPAAPAGLAGLRYRLAVAFSRGLGRVHLNDVHSVDEGGARFYLKSRRRTAALLVRLGNPYLQWMRAGVTALDDEQSSTWTRKVYSAAYGLTISEDAQGRLAIPAAEGRVLVDILGDDALPLAAKLEAVGLASAALRRLHGVEVDGAPLSHSDATTSNVACDLARGRAQWFDFDMRHDASRPALWRCADDLRALITSAACGVREQTYPELARAAIGAYSEPAVLVALGEQIEAQRGRLNTYHLAQAPLSHGARAALESALHDAIRGVTGR